MEYKVDRPFQCPCAVCLAVREGRPGAGGVAVRLIPRLAARHECDRANPAFQPATAESSSVRVFGGEAPGR